MSRAFATLAATVIAFALLTAVAASHAQPVRADAARTVSGGAR